MKWLQWRWPRLGKFEYITMGGVGMAFEALVERLEFVAWWLLCSPCANKLQLHAMPIKEVLRQDDGMTMTQKPRT